MKNAVILSAIGLVLLAACTAETPKKPLMVETIVSSSEPIVPGEPFPPFKEHFSSGTTVIYTYISFENTETMTGAFPVRLRWFYPNDFRPPIAQHVVSLEPSQRIAQFSIHNENGLPIGPYMLIPAYGKDQSSLTETGSARFFVGMTDEEAKKFIKEETEFRAKRDEEMAKREEERKKQEAEAAAWAEKWRANMEGKDTFDVEKKGNVPKLKKGVKPKDLLPKAETGADALPPSLTDGS